MDAQYDIFEAMVAWVERDDEPGTLTSVKYKEDNVTLGLDFERPLCIVRFHSLGRLSMFTN